MQRLKEFRVSTGLSMCKMARILDVSLSFYEKIERAHIQPSRAFMQKMKRAFPDINIDSVFFSDIEAVVKNA